MIEVLQTIVGLLTGVLIFLALPLWMWWFDRNITLHLPDYARRRAGTYMVVGMGWLALTLYLIWTYVLPDWWIEHTLLLGSSE